jgi:hypothetical protein
MLCHLSYSFIYPYGYPVDTLFIELLRKQCSFEVSVTFLKFHSLGYYNFTPYLKHTVKQSTLFFKNCLTILGYFHFHINLKISLSKCTKTPGLV